MKLNDNAKRIIKQWLDEIKDVNLTYKPKRSKDD